MNYFDILYLFTIPLYLLSIHFLFLSKFKTNQNSTLLKIYGAFGITLIVAHLMINTPIITFAVNIVFQFILSSIYTSNLSQRYSSVLQITALILVIEMIYGLFFGILQVTFFTQSNFDSILGLVIVRIILCAISFQLYRSNYRKIVEYPLHNHYYFVFSCIMIGLLFLYFVSVTQPDLPEIYLLLCSITLLLVVALILHLEDNTQKIYQNYIESIIVMDQSVALENQRELMKQSLHISKSIRHDIKNQILVLLSLGENKNYDEMIAQMKQMIDEVDGSKAISSTGHVVIDSLLNYKLNQHDDIYLNVNLNVSEDLPILAYDLTIILGNLLDNAITAVKHLDRNKNMTVFIENTKGNFVLIIENSFQGKVLYENGRYHSTKAFSASHGFGLENIRKSVNKYNGSMDVSHGSEKFKVVIVIPI